MCKMVSYLVLCYFFFLSLNVTLKLINNHCLGQRFITLTKQFCNSSVWRIIFFVRQMCYRDRSYKCIWKKWVEISCTFFYSIDLISNLQNYIRKSSKVIIMATNVSYLILWYLFISLNVTLKFINKHWLGPTVYHMNKTIRNLCTWQAIFFPRQICYRHGEIE